MTPSIAIGFLAVLIVLIGAAFCLNFIRLRPGSKFTQISVRATSGKTLTLFARNWIAALSVGALAGSIIAGASILARAPHLLAVLGAGLAFGAVTINWTWPATGTTGPTAAQVGNQDSVKATVTTDGAATTFTLTHNLNISAADIANGFPDIGIEPYGATGIPATLLLLITAPVTANAVVFTCAAVVGTFRVKISRPYSQGR
jgi:hypothetical protein